MTNAPIAQDNIDETGTKYGHTDNTKGFRYAYGRLNATEQKKEQTLFCYTYGITPASFRARLSGAVRVSDTELAYLKGRVATYFPEESAITTH